MTETETGLGRDDDEFSGSGWSKTPWLPLLLLLPFSP
jgi:hypothetical protein